MLIGVVAGLRIRRKLTEQRLVVAPRLQRRQLLAARVESALIQTARIERRLAQIERGLRLPSAEVLRQLATALGVPPETLYARAGLLGPPSVTVDLVSLIRNDPQLDEDQKRTLVHIYESFRAGGDDPARTGTVPATVGVGGESSGKDIG